MTWSAFFTGVAGGAAFAVVAVPLILWFVIGYLSEEFDAICDIARSASLRAPQPPAANPAPPPAGSGWPGRGAPPVPGYVRDVSGVARPRDGYPGGHPGLRGYDPIGWD